MELPQLIDQYGSLKKKANQLYSEYKDMQVQLAEMSHILQMKLVESGVKSLKTDHFTVSRSEKPTIIIDNEQAVIDWLKTTPEVESDFYIGLKATPFKQMALAMMKDTGELASGTSLEIKESLSIRSAK